MNQSKIDEKKLKIEALVKELKVELKASQIVTKSGLIENVIVYLDMEQYPQEKVETTSEK